MAVWKMTLILWIVLALTSVFASQDSRIEHGEQGQVRTLNQSWYADKAVEISKENPSIRIETLQKDQIEIRAAYPQVKLYYADKAFGDSEAELLDIVGRAWSDFRRKDAATGLTSDDFVKFAEEYGGLRIRSSPPGAVIHVDERRWDDYTNAKGAARVGVRTIKLSLAGYQEETGTAVVTPGQWAIFSRTLKKK